MMVKVCDGGDDDINKNTTKTPNYAFIKLMFNYTSLLTISNRVLYTLNYLVIM